MQKRPATSRRTTPRTRRAWIVAIPWTTILAFACSDGALPFGGYVDGSVDGSVIRDGASSDATGADGAGRTDSAIERDGETSTSTDAGTSGDGGTRADANASSDAGTPVDVGPDATKLDNDRRDSDCDGLSDAEEFSTIYRDGQKTDPENPDTDGDGILDGVEMGRTSSVAESRCPPIADADPSDRSSPTNGDTDGDGIPDGAEDRNRNGAVDSTETNPNLTDTDGDGIPDNVEDANRDGVRDAGELDPSRRDTDADGISDGIEDEDRDGDVDAGETDPLDRDTDNDGLDDGAEDANHNGARESWETDPAEVDSDCDGIGDLEESTLGTSPLVTDSDRDGIPDGVERGVTGPVAGSACATVATDGDPNSTTDPATADGDGDGLPDGVEDANQNGVVDVGETDPDDADGDNDGFSDGDEILAGFDPFDPTDPPANQQTGVHAVCDDSNLKAVDFHAGSAWTLVTERSFAYAPATIATPGFDAAAIDDATNSVAGFVLRMPLVGGALPNASAQEAGIDARARGAAAAEGLGYVVRLTPRNTRSHDGFDSMVSGIIDVHVATGARDAAEVRNALLRMASGLGAASVTGLPAHTGTGASDWVYAYEVLLRSAPDELIVVGAVATKAAFDQPADVRGILLADLTNGSAIARAGATAGKRCDPFTATGDAKADFIWMADISGSTNNDRSRIATASQRVFDELATLHVDFRMGVVPHSSNDIKLGAGNGGVLRGLGFFLPNERTAFIAAMNDTSGSDGCEFGLEAAGNAVRRALPRSAPGQVQRTKLRDDATLAVVYVSDEFAQELTMSTFQRCSKSGGGNYNPACDTGIGDTGNNGAACNVVPNASQAACIDTIVTPYVSTLVANRGIAFAQIILPSATAQNCTAYRCPTDGDTANEPGRGYREVVDRTGGSTYSPCNPDPGTALESIVAAVSGAASEFVLSGPPISSTIQVGVARIGSGGPGTVDMIPRSKTDGFDYDSVANSIFFRGETHRPNVDDLVVVSYRVWREPESACVGPCAPGMVCDPESAVCACDAATCAACGPTEICDASCNCACAPDCGGRCRAGEVCSASCTCECASDCGGCPAGTVCDPSTCACECPANCAGACDETSLVCNASTCSCECPSDCGGACTGNTVCNGSLCACTCTPECDDACPGAARCDVAANCACACPSDCGGCPSGTTCDSAACACTCPDTPCENLRIRDLASDCTCVCPADCGGACNPGDICEPSTCRCVPGF